MAVAGVCKPGMAQLMGLSSKLPRIRPQISRPARYTPCATSNTTQPRPPKSSHTEHHHDSASKHTNVPRRLLCSGMIALAASSCLSLPGPAASSPDPEQAAPPRHTPPADGWWEVGASSWVELSSIDDLNAFLIKNKNSTKLLAVEFYAKWCPVCASKSPELLTVVSNQRMRDLCTFARADIETMRGNLAEIGIKHVPTMIMYSPEGYKLIDFIAAADSIQEAVVALSPVFKEPVKVPTSYQADLANLPNMPDELDDDSADDALPMTEAQLLLQEGFSVADGAIEPARVSA